MRRLLVLLTLTVAASALGVVACGGNDKPPLTPDLVEPPADQLEAGAPTAPPAPAK
ncbi:hypothetical protein BH11MYX4_BH11MYX4_04930 [soil metagenome]